MKRQTSPDGANGKGSYESLDFHPYEELDLMDPVYANAPIVSFSPSTRVKPFILGGGSLDTVAKRMGIHYLRMPYFSRDVKHAKAKQIEEVFARTKDGNDYNFLARHDELRIQNSAGTLSNDARPQANYHTHFGFHYMHLSTMTVLAHIQAVVFGRAEGFLMSPDITSTVKFSVINGMLSQFNGMPINRAFIEYCVSQMSVLADRNDKSILVSFPEWLPMGMAYYNEFPNVADAENKMEYVDRHTMRHMNVEEYEATSGFRNRFAGTATVTDDNWEVGAIIPTGYNYTRGKGYFIDHWLEMAQGYIDQFGPKFTYNSEYGKLNVTQSINRIADFWSQMGFVDSRLQAGDLAKWADEVSGRVQDLQSFASENWSDTADRFSPMFMGMTNNDATVTAATTTFANAMGLARWEDPTEFDFCDDTVTTIMKRKALAPTADKDAWFPRSEIPYCFAVAPSGGSIVDLLQANDFELLVNDGTADAILKPQTGIAFGPGCLGDIIQALWQNLKYSVPRYVNKSLVGKFLDRSLADESAYIDMSLLNSGFLAPVWKISPVIDPVDYWTHGVHEVVDFSATYVPDMATPKQNNYSPASFAKHVVEAAANHSGDALTGTSELLTAIGLSSPTVTVKGYIFTHKAASGASFRTVVRAATVFTGDALNLHALAHLGRADILRYTHGFLENAAFNQLSLIPVQPVRKYNGADTLQMIGYGLQATEGASLTGLSINITTGETTYDPSTFDGSLRNAYNSGGLWKKFMMPMMFPSMQRLQSEYIDGGAYVYAGKTINVELSFSGSKPKGSATNTSVKAGVHREPKKNFGKKKFDKGRGDKKEFSSKPWEKKSDAVDSKSTDFSYLGKDDDKPSDVTGKDATSFVPKDKRD